MIAFDHVSRDFDTPDGRHYRALDDISLTIAAGSVRRDRRSERLRQVDAAEHRCRAAAPSSGTVRVDGRAADGLNRRATYMFQQDALLPWKDVRENVALGLTLAGVARAEAHARADAGSQRVGLAAFAAHYPVAAERRHAQARRDGAELDHRSRHRC